MFATVGVASDKLDEQRFDQNEFTERGASF